MSFLFHFVSFTAIGFLFISSRTDHTTIIRPQRMLSTDAAYCYRRNIVVCLCLCVFPSVNHALISPILPHPVVWVALPPLVPSTHHSHHPSPLHSFTPDLQLSFPANPSHHSLPFLLLDWLHGFPGLFTDTSEHIRFFSLLFLLSTVSFPDCRLILLM